MKNNSYILIESILRQFIVRIKNDPERSIRNSIDMVLSFANGRFQKKFFGRIQKVLENEQSIYYPLVWDTIMNVDEEKLITVGMNIGYNSCTVGAETIRNIEEKQHFNIPWSITLKLNEKTYRSKKEAYRSLIEQGKALGIFTWFLHIEGNIDFAESIISGNEDCAFVIFCEPDFITDSAISIFSKLNNTVLCVKYKKRTAEICEKLRQNRMLYSVYTEYNDDNITDILNDMLLKRVEYLHPVFTVLVPEEGCSEMVRNIVYKYVQDIRTKQQYQTILWEYKSDGLNIDKVISEDSCYAEINENGFINGRTGKDTNCFEAKLKAVFKNCLPK